MPLILAFTDTDGTEYTESYWRIANYGANDRVKTGSFQMHGWRDIDAYVDGKDTIRASPKEFLITDPAVYDEYFGVALLVSDFPFLEVLESYAFAGDFFSSASQYSYLEVLSADIGSFDSSRIYVRFSDIVEFDIGGNYLDGVTVSVNSVPVTVSAAAQDSPGSVIRYDLASPLDANDVITWAYEESAGFLVSAGGVRVSDIPNESVTNQIGGFLHFNSADNSIHLATAA
jgi:hypothetical protein